jgi:ATP-dependent phosphofructokinase / diphosphate-dependent phosphofructokinase
MPAKLLIAQGGGPTAVINQSLVGAVLEARRHAAIGAVYGARHGVRGIIDQDLIDLGRETESRLERIALTPAAALGSTRDKPDAAYCEAIFKVLRAHDIGYFLYIGGNDSADTVRIVSEAAQQAGYPLCALHVPKTIDNDLTENDHTPGYPSAARFVIQAFKGVDLDNRALQGVYLAVVMGRNAGFLTAASGLARQYPDAGPHLVYLPERAFDTDRFLADVDAAYRRHGRCVIAVSEGIRDATGELLASRLMSGERDAHGNVQLSGSGALADQLSDLIKSRLGIKRVRGDTLGYLQRSFTGCVSEVDQREAREAGEQAVQFALAGQGGSVALRRVGDYAVEFALVPLASVAAHTRTMPDAFINAEANHVTEAFHAYLNPLLGSALPVTERLSAVPVEPAVLE